MRASLLIILVFLGIYTTWVQKTTREVLATTSANEESLREQLKVSEIARISAEVALDAAKRDLEKFRKAAGSLEAGSADREKRPVPASESVACSYEDLSPNAGAGRRL